MKTKLRTIQISAGSVRVGDSFQNIERTGSHSFRRVVARERNGHWIKIQVTDRTVHEMGFNFKVIVRRK